MNEKGIALIGALIMMLITFVFGGAAMLMSHYGYFTQSSERKYQAAHWAAEFAISSGINAVKVNQVCNMTSASSLTNGAAYSWFTVDDQLSKNCFIQGTGTFFGAKVVKTTVVPVAASNWGALTLRSGGTLNLSGSSSIANCDSTCRGPAVVTGGAVTGSYSTDTTCKNNNKGIVGDSAISFTSLGDLVQRFFYATSFSDLQSKLQQKYVVDLGVLSILNPSCSFSCGSGSCSYSVPAGCSTVLITGASSTTTISGSLNNKTIVSNGTIRMTSKMDYSQVFASNLVFDIGSNDKFRGGVYFARNNITVQGNGGPEIGTYDPSYPNDTTKTAPALIIAGGGLTKEGNGNVSLKGLLFTNGSYFAVNKGNFTVNWAVASNSTTASAFAAATGNASLNFDSAILNILFNQINSQAPYLVKTPNCGSQAERLQFIDMTKMSVY